MEKDTGNAKGSPLQQAVSDVYNMAGKTKYRWFVLFIIFCLYTVATADRSNVGLAMPFIRQEFSMSNTEAGAIMSLFFAGYVISMIPGGFILKKLGARTTVPLFTSGFTALLGFTNSVAMMKVCCLGTGLSEGPTAVGMPTTFNNWFPAREKGFATGIFLGASKFGPLIVPPLCGMIVLLFGWREIFRIFAIPGIIFAILWYILIANKPAQSRFTNQAEVNYIEHVDGLDVKKQEEVHTRKYNMVWLDRIVRVKKSRKSKQRKNSLRIGI